MEATFASRHHRFEGCFNFRDIGGYSSRDGRRVKWGCYYRAGRQDRMTGADLARFEQLGIRTQIDLRGPGEIADQGRGPLEYRGVAYHNLQVIPEGGAARLDRLVGDRGISGKRYLGYLAFGPEIWLRMFDIFSDSSSPPVLIHCTAGKDRTGVATALLLSVLGIDRKTIETDYRFTNIDVPRQVEFVERTRGLPDDMDRQALMRHAGVPEDALVDFFDGLDEKYGGAIGYLRGIGVSEEQMDTVRSIFLEELSLCP